MAEEVRWEAVGIDDPEGVMSTVGSLTLTANPWFWSIRRGVVARDLTTGVVVESGHISGHQIDRASQKRGKQVLARTLSCEFAEAALKKITK